MLKSKSDENPLIDMSFAGSRSYFPNSVINKSQKFLKTNVQLKQLSKPQ